jgi:hypothetical protein
LHRTKAGNIDAQRGQLHDSGLVLSWAEALLRGGRANAGGE